MSRISRKPSDVPPVPLTIARIYSVGLYLRLSKEDRESDCIDLQEQLLNRYVTGQPDMRRSAVFRDNGATGTNFERPGFESMMDAVRKREIDCIVVKDLSRFGRNYVETGDYLERIFPFLGVRFVAVNDGYDTLKIGNGAEMAVSLKNVINAQFAKDISKKTASALHSKQEKGMFIGSFAPYGYQKNPEDKHRLVIDPETAPVVRQIFAWRLEKRGYSEIAKRLNEGKVPSPSMARLLSGQLHNENSLTLGNLWTAAAIKRIIRHMVYEGHMVQGKERRSLYDGIPKRQVEQGAWLIKQNTHEPIVSQNLWKQVQSVDERIEER